jgi:hypothetical protein
VSAPIDRGGDPVRDVVEAARQLVDGMAVSFDDIRLGYIEAHIDRTDRARLIAALDVFDAAGGGADGGGEDPLIRLYWPMDVTDVVAITEAIVERFPGALMRPGGRYGDIVRAPADPPSPPRRGS